MTVQFGSASFSYVTDGSSNTTIVGGAPPDIQVGEVMLAHLSGSDSGNPGAGSAPSGWTVAASNYETNGQYRSRQMIAWKVYSGSETAADFTFNITSHGNDDSLVIQRVYGDLDTSNLISIVSGFAGEYTPEKIFPVVTTVAPDSTVVYFASVRNGGSALADDTGQPTGTNILYNRRSRANSSAIRTASAYEVASSTGETQTRTWDGFTSVAQYGSTITVVINEQSGPAPDPDPAIDPTGTDTTLVNGSSHQISFTGLTATPASFSLAYGGNVFEQPNFSIGAVTEGVAIANFTAAIGNLPYTSAAYPASGFSYLVAGDNGTELTLSGITINPSADRSVVTAVNPVNDSTSIIPSWLEGGAVTGDQIDWPKVVGNIQPAVNADFTHSGARIDGNIPWPDSITFTINYWDSITSIRYAVTVEVAYAEDGTGTVIGITTRELTTRSLTVRNLTMRSL